MLALQHGRRSRNPQNSSIAVYLSYYYFFLIPIWVLQYLLGHIYLSVTFGTPENYKTEFLRFEVARFDCGYNAIIGRPGLAKFMAIPHYSYMILKMPGPQGIITGAPTSKAPQNAFRVSFKHLSPPGPW
jgi:hypothetical protein